MIGKMARRARPSARPAVDPAHAPGKHKLGPPPGSGMSPHDPAVAHGRQPWLATSAAVSRKRRAARNG
jgi:hypothetical protein